MAREVGEKLWVFVCRVQVVVGDSMAGYPYARVFRGTEVGFQGLPTAWFLYLRHLCRLGFRGDVGNAQC